MTYTYDEFTVDVDGVGGFFQTYQFLDADGGNANDYPWLTITYDEANDDLVFVVDTQDDNVAGDYTITVIGTLSDPDNETVQTTITFTLVDIIPTPQDELIYIIGDDIQLVDGIEPFTIEVDTGDYVINYETTCDDNAGSGQLDVSWMDVDADTSLTVGLLDDTDANELLAGSYTCRLTGELALAASPTIGIASDYIDHDVHLIKLEGYPYDIEYRMTDGTELTYPITPFTFGPTSADDPDIPDYTFDYEIRLADGTTLESYSWLDIDDDGAGNFWISIAQEAQGFQPPAILDLVLVGIVDGVESATKSYPF